ncbi:MAG: class I SAM-dependent methyltransferase, partial [Candidatus Latescibacteria bacterium]|nr:class I SAM-dependent methyltransferase [Candidatus Latescibacterota bacterium]
VEKIYPLLARQIVDDYGITSGVCLDVGSGAGQVGIELAERTSLRVVLLDVNVEVLAVAKQHARASAACDRVIPLRADVHRLPFAAGSVDLIVSRGSIFFWEDKPKGLREVYRILKPGGIALVGGGAGRYLPARERERFVRK